MIFFINSFHYTTAGTGLLPLQEMFFSHSSLLLQERFFSHNPYAGKFGCKGQLYCIVVNCWSIVHLQPTSSVATIKRKHFCVSILPLTADYCLTLFIAQALLINPPGVVQCLWGNSRAIFNDAWEGWMERVQIHSTFLTSSSQTRCVKNRKLCESCQ